MVLAAIGLPLMLGSPVEADDRPPPVPLQLPLQVNGAAPVKLTLTGGRTMIGRIIKLDSDSITIRRPTGGLDTLAVAEIEHLDMRDEERAPVRGRIISLAAGPGFQADRPGTGGQPRLTAATGTADGREAGGPLIRLTRGSLEGQNPAEPPPPTTTANVAPSQVRLHAAAQPASEADDALVFRLQLSEPSTRPIAIIFTMLHGTARAALDYIHRQGVVVFEPGQIEAAITIDLVHDDIAEERETVRLFLIGDPNTITIEDRKIDATIEDDD